MFTAIFLEIFKWFVLHYYFCMFVMEEQSLLQSNFVLQAASPWGRNTWHQYNIQVWSDCY